MSNGRSPREVCSITIGISGLTGRALPRAGASARAPGRHRPADPRRARSGSLPWRGRRSRPAAPRLPATRRRLRELSPKGERARRRGSQHRRPSSAPRLRARGPRGSRIRTPGRAPRVSAACRSREQVRRRARGRRTGRSVDVPARRRARPSSRPPAGVPRRPMPLRSDRSSFVLGEPREHCLAREPPLLSNLARRDLLPLGHPDHRLRLDLQEAGELLGGEDLELLHRARPGATDAELPLRAPEPAQRGRILRVDLLRDEPRDQLALRSTEGTRRAVQLVRFGGGDPDEDRRLVALSPWSRHRRYLDIKKISRAQAKLVPYQVHARARAPGWVGVWDGTGPTRTRV